VQNILGDLFASLSIGLDKPFVIGDFVIVDKYLGTVEHVGLKTTRIRSLSGEQLVSNADLLKSRLQNMTRMSRRRVVFGSVTFDTPREKLAAIAPMLHRQGPAGRHLRPRPFPGHRPVLDEFRGGVLGRVAGHVRFMDIQQKIIDGLQAGMRVWFNCLVQFGAVRPFVGGSPATFSSVRLRRDRPDPQGRYRQRFTIIHSHPNRHVPAARLAHEFHPEPTGLRHPMPTSTGACPSAAGTGRHLRIPGREATLLAGEHARFADIGTRVLSAAPAPMLQLIHDKARFYAETVLPQPRRWRPSAASKPGRVRRRLGAAAPRHAACASSLRTRSTAWASPSSTKNAAAPPC
jgi:hypothetical protein